MGMLRKMSTKNIMEEAGVKDWAKFAEGETKKLLYSVAGTAVGVKKGESSFGPWVAFTGEFFALVPNVKETISAGKLYLPPGFGDGLEAQLSHADSKGLVFSLNVFIKPPGPKDTVKYIYAVEPLVKPQESDANNRLLKQMQESQAEIAGQSAAKKSK